MPKSTHIPMFPLAIMPLPGELVPLHIFEPRYQQLLQDLEIGTHSFGIFFNHDINKERFGSLMRLENVVRRFPGGESDIVVRCTSLFIMEKLYRTFESKRYPGGDVVTLSTDRMTDPPGTELIQRYVDFRKQLDKPFNFTTINLFTIAVELNLDVYDRYRLLMAPDEQKEKFLLAHITYQHFILEQADNTRDSFHLN